MIRSISQKNVKLRIFYKKKHENLIDKNFWQYVHFTNETHFDLNQTFQERVLREKDIKYESKNTQTMSNMKKVKLHIIVFVSWHYKSVLQFYNDEHDMFDIQITKSRKSRKKKHDINDKYR
jgi:hypothetical protein